jgi:hypothetical protein
MLLYNPNPEGGTTSLVERSGGNAPGIGVYRLEMLSDVVRDCCAQETSVDILVHCRQPDPPSSHALRSVP